jgi:hypothetical protein
MLLHEKGVVLHLLHIYNIPVTYTADGMTLVAMGDALERAEDRIEEEVARAKAMAPGMEIEGRVITGSFLDALSQETDIVQPLFIILATADFGEVYLGDSDPLDALRSFGVPVLFVPQGAALRPITHMAYACNYAYLGPHTPINEIKNLVGFLKASLQVVHADAHPQGYDEEQSRGEEWLRNQLAPLSPVFHWQQDDDVLHGITSFVNNHNIDCLVVVPRKYGLWQSLFHQSRTKALARLNNVPVLAFHIKEA